MRLQLSVYLISLFTQYWFAIQKLEVIHANIYTVLKCIYMYMDDFSIDKQLESSVKAILNILLEYTKIRGCDCPISVFGRNLKFCYILLFLVLMTYFSSLCQAYCFVYNVIAAAFWGFWLPEFCVDEYVYFLRNCIGLGSTKSIKRQNILKTYSNPLPNVCNWFCSTRPSSSDSEEMIQNCFLDVVVSLFELNQTKVVHLLLVSLFLSGDCRFCHFIIIFSTTIILILHCESVLYSVVV